VYLSNKLRFDIVTDCTYLLATDGCNGEKATYKILVEHEERFNSTFFIKQLHVFLDGDTYLMASNITVGLS
jgi:hypothetical protein